MISLSDSMPAFLNARSIARQRVPALFDPNYVPSRTQAALLARLSGLGQLRRLGPDKIKGIAEKVYTTASIGVAVTAAILGGGWGGSSRCIRLSKRRNSGSGSV